MTTAYRLESASMGHDGRTRELVFAGDQVRLAGQIDYPQRPLPPEGYPLIVVLHHAGGNTRDDYMHYATTALHAGYAVFRWDKRGTGKSGGGGRGSAVKDAINAYQVALTQPDIDATHVVIWAQGEGTLLLSDVFADFSMAQRPYGALLVGNLLDQHDILAIDTQVQIIIGADDWISWEVYGKQARDAHLRAFKHGASFSVAHHADRLLIDTRYPDEHRFHVGAKHIITDWLRQID